MVYHETTIGCDLSEVGTLRVRVCTFVYRPFEVGFLTDGFRGLERRNGSPTSKIKEGAYRDLNTWARFKSISYVPVILRFSVRQGFPAAAWSEPRV